jgi:hypothetical protein
MPDPGPPQAQNQTGSHNNEKQMPKIKPARHASKARRAGILIILKKEAVPILR